MLPIVTHPERNTILQRIDDLARWVEMGCYVQVTAGSILGGFGRKARSSAIELLDSRAGALRRQRCARHLASSAAPRRGVQGAVHGYGEERPGAVRRQPGGGADG